MKLIDKYKQWMEAGIIGTPACTGGGLCNLVPSKYKKYFSCLKVTEKEKKVLREEALCDTFWGSGLEKRAKYKELAFSFTPLRQTIVLLICAMCDEL